MKKITFNKSDWSGEKGSIKLYKNGEFTLMGYQFKLVEKCNDDYVKYIIKSADGQWGEEYELGAVTKWDDQKYWLASQYDICRTNEIKEIAAAKLLYNTI